MGAFCAPPRPISALSISLLFCQQHIVRRRHTRVGYRRLTCGVWLHRRTFPSPWVAEAESEPWQAVASLARRSWRCASGPWRSGLLCVSLEIGGILSLPAEAYGLGLLTFASSVEHQQKGSNSYENEQPTAGSAACNGGRQGSRTRRW
eukprot:scaffold284979_cov28-Tisochrysis_lutea.AAC.1